MEEKEKLCGNCTHVIHTFETKEDLNLICEVDGDFVDYYDDGCASWEDGE